MTYDIYFHNDFDGRASAATVLAFLRSRGDDIEHFVPVDFDLEHQWLKDGFFKSHTLFKGRHNPAIIVDFLYHPGATMWFDHHPTSIKRADWRKKFKRSKNFNWDSSYPSCCHWVYVALKKNFGWKPPAHFADLAKWLDVIDGARYKSARQAIEMKEPALQLEGFIEKTDQDRELATWIVKLFAEKSFTEIAAIPKVRRIVAAYRREAEKSLAFYKKNLVITGKVGFIDLTRANVKRSLYAPFYFHPSIRYGMRYTRKGPWFHVSAGENPWRPTGKVAFGKLMQKYGGGGHQTVGGVEFYEQRKADKAIREIIDVLNTKG
jgi:hypothetical protein